MLGRLRSLLLQWVGAVATATDLSQVPVVLSTSGSPGIADPTCAWIFFVAAAGMGLFATFEAFSQWAQGKSIEEFEEQGIVEFVAAKK